MATARGVPSDQEEKMSWTETFRSLKTIPAFLRLVWSTSPSMALANILLRVIQAATPLALLYVGKLIIDEIIALSASGAVNGAAGAASGAAGAASGAASDGSGLSLFQSLAGADLEQLWWYVGIEFGLALLTALLSRSITLMDALLGDLFANETSLRLIRKASTLDLPQFEDPTFYDKMERARQQTLGRTVLMSQLLTQAQEVVTFIFLAAGLAIFNPWLLLILAVAVAPVFFNETFFNQRTYSLTRNWTPQRRELDYLRLIGASNNTAKEVKVFGLSDFLAERFGKLANLYYQANKKLSIRRAFWGSLFNMIGDVGYYFAYVFIIVQTINGRISVGDLTFLAGSFSRMRNLLQAMLARLSTIAQRSLYLQDLFDFLEMKPIIANPQKPLPIPTTIKEGFRFENVGFCYPGTDIWALRGLNFHLKAGEKLALVGENGAGKTTLVKLLSRLYDPNEGRILLEGHDLREYDLDGLRGMVGVIFQDFVRFSLSASENIAIGRIDDKDDLDRIQYSAEQSLAASVIEKLPEGYDQMLGRRFTGGLDLSGGEWQKVALGRAYMRDAHLIILDEPTAALDARAEFEVFERFAELTAGKTAVLISHRFSTVRMADRILVLKNGMLSEIGSHEELLEAGGLYSELFKLQARGYA